MNNYTKKIQIKFYFLIVQLFIFIEKHFPKVLRVKLPSFQLTFLKLLFTEILNALNILDIL